MHSFDHEPYFYSPWSTAIFYIKQLIICFTLWILFCHSSSETLQLAADKRLAKQSIFKSPTNLRLHRDLCNQVHSAARTKKNKWLHQNCTEINNNSRLENSTCYPYRLIKNINCNWQPKQRCIKGINGKILHEKVKKRWTE